MNYLYAFYLNSINVLSVDRVSSFSYFDKTIYSHLACSTIIFKLSSITK